MIQNAQLKPQKSKSEIQNRTQITSSKTKNNKHDRQYDNYIKSQILSKFIVLVEFFIFNLNTTTHGIRYTKHL